MLVLLNFDENVDLLRVLVSLSLLLGFSLNELSFSLLAVVGESLRRGLIFVEIEEVEEEIL